MGNSCALSLLSESYQSLSTHEASLDRYMDASRCGDQSISPCLTPELIAFRVDNDLQWRPRAVWNDIVAKQNLVHSHGPCLQSGRNSVTARLTPTLNPAPWAKKPLFWLRPKRGLGKS